MAHPVVERIEPEPGQESVWDYPRPPRLERSSKHLVVGFADLVVADSRRAMKVMETASPPTYYVPPEDVRMDLLEPTDSRTTFCEWKGSASYFDLSVGERRAVAVGWTYPSPTPAFAELAGHVAFYPGRVDAAFLDDEPVRPQPGRYYGGWVTREIVGPFKGEPGSEGW